MERRPIRPKELIFVESGKMMSFGREGRVRLQVTGAIYDYEDDTVGISLGSSAKEADFSRRFNQGRVCVEHHLRQVSYVEIEEAYDDLPIECLLGDLEPWRSN